MHNKIGHEKFRQADRHRHAEREKKHSGVCFANISEMISGAKENRCTIAVGVL